jgi:hypothetical protein
MSANETHPWDPCNDRRDSYMESDVSLYAASKALDSGDLAGAVVHWQSAAYHLGAANEYRYDDLDKLGAAHREVGDRLMAALREAQEDAEWNAHPCSAMRP